jgi:hypothetical protein
MNAFVFVGPTLARDEILWALNQGIPVLGAASMGALRAAELHSFGMTGVGRIFEAYRDGHLEGWDDAFEDDDEVAVIHAPTEAGGFPLSDAMVDLRDTLARAEAAGIIGRATRDDLARRNRGNRTGRLAACQPCLPESRRCEADATKIGARPSGTGASAHGTRSGVGGVPENAYNRNQG